MQWAMTMSGTGGSENGGWGDCSVYNIDAFGPVGNTNAHAGDLFGRAVSISGDYAIVGAPSDDEGLRIVDLRQS
jgi:hypothetical protein